MARREVECDNAPGSQFNSAVRGDATAADELSSAAAKDQIWNMDSEEKARRIDDEDLNRMSKQNHSGFLLLWLTWQSIGTIYSDIGTSPLYVYSSTFSSQPSWHDLVGALSIIIWSLTLIVTIKYCFIALFADDDGQGGVFALYSLLARHTNAAYRDPNIVGMMRLNHRIGNVSPVGRAVRNFLENSSAAQSALKIIGVFGVSMAMADGVLTPAQSVLGAVQGITVTNAHLTTKDIIGISCAILIVLFMVQPFGTAAVGTSFAPIVVVWLLFNLCSGIYNLAVHDYTVLKAFNPQYAFAYLIRNKSDGWKSLGGLLLAFTGVEALFANMGAFGRRAIQLSWLGLAYPCLIFAYAGQAAFISVDGSQKAFNNPFFNTVPPGTFYFSIVIAVLAAIIASQAMIISSFQLTSQVMRLSYLPHIRTVHTSRKFHGQVYIPLANWLLMIGTVAVTAVFNNTTSLGNAYGVCVTIVNFITTCMVSLVAIIMWRRIPPLLVVLFFLIFAALDGAFMLSALQKVPEGAWFTIVLAFAFSVIFILWRFGKEQQWAAEAEDRIALSQFLHSPHISSKTPRDNQYRPVVTLSPANGPGNMSTVSGLGIFFDKVGGGDNTVPKVFAQFLRKFKARPEVIVFFHMRPLPIPTVPPAERFIITRESPETPLCYRLTLRHGYTDYMLTPDLERIMVHKLVNFITRGGGDRHSELLPAVREEAEALYRAQDAQTLYVIGKQVMKVRVGQGKIFKRAIRKLALEVFLWIRENSRTKLADLDVDIDKLAEIGFVMEI